MRILMVCLGNICRSPLAEGIMDHYAKESGLFWEIDSAGTGGWHTGEHPHQLSRKVAKHHGIDISRQRARVFVREDIHRFDRIFVMDQSNYEEVKRICGNEWNEEKIDYLLNQLEPGKNNEVPDPWSYPEEKYHEVFELIKNACRSFINGYLHERDLK